MTNSADDELAIYESSVLSASEAATILLDSFGNLAFSVAGDRLKSAVSARHEIGIMFWNKALGVLLEKARPTAASGHDA